MGTLSNWTAESYEDVPDLWVTWTGHDVANWVLSGDENSVTQATNCRPSVFYGDFDAHGKLITATVVATTISDDDFIGFVIGWTPGDADSSTADYLLVDWKKGTQYFVSETANIGLALSRVSGDVAVEDLDLWGHSGKVSELARAETKGSSEYVFGTTYTFEFDIGVNRLVVTVNGTKEFDVTGSFSNGRFGFYNYSQDSVDYALSGYSEGTFSTKKALMFSFSGGLA